MSRKNRIAGFALLPLLLGTGHPLFSTPAEKVVREAGLNVLLVTLDTTRADHIGAYGWKKAGTPNIDALAAGGVRFARAYCSVPLTLPSHCSILTGTYPLYHKVRDNGAFYLGEEAVTLAERLKQAGYASAAFAASFNTDSRFGLGQGFDVYDDRFVGDDFLKTYLSERKGDKVADSFLSWFEANHQKKFFSWVHFFDPHAPYEPPSPYKERFPGDPYGGEVAFMDHELGRIIEALRKKGVLDRTLVVVAGDHGESLGEHGESSHGIFIYDSTMRVPLIFHAPGNLPNGQVVNARVGLNEIMPTVLELLKLSVNPEVQGVSVLPYIEGKKSEDQTCYLESFYPLENYGWSELVGIIDGSWKYIRAPRPELYDLKLDPGETKDQAGRDARTAALLDKKLDDLIRARVSSVKPGRRTMTGEEQDRLRSLGYVGGSGSAKAGKGPRPDPKDAIGELNTLARAIALKSEKKFGESEKCYRELLGLRPDTPWYYAGLGTLLMEVGRADEAIEIMKDGLERMPDSVILLTRLANFYQKVERVVDASRISRVLLEADPRNFEGTVIAGWAEDMQGHWKEAADFYRRALEIEPENKTVRMKFAYVLGALGNGEEAARLDEALKKEYPDEPRIYIDLSVIYTALGKMDLAEKNLRRAVALSPAPENHHRLAVLLARTGNYKEAVAQMRIYLQKTTEGETPRKARARASVAEWERLIK